MSSRVSTVGFPVAILALGLAGCGGGGASSASRDVIVDGSSTVFRISRAAMEGFNKVQPEVLVVVNNHGTGGGFGKYLAGEVDIVDASRPAKPDEEKKAIEGNMPWTRFLVGWDGITVVVNPKNEFVESLTVDQLKGLFEPDSKVSTWKDLDPSWPDRKIVIFSPDKDSGTFDFFTEEITGKSKAQRKDVQPSPDDNVLVTGVSGDPDAIGYFGYAYYAANASKLRAVPIRANKAAPAVAASPETILSKEYKPLSRPLYIYVKNAAMARPEVLGFVTYYLGNIENLSRSSGYVPPTAEDQETNKKALSAGGPAPATVAKGG